MVMYCLSHRLVVAYHGDRNRMAADLRNFNSLVARKYRTFSQWN
jgi:hypothetical protein